MYESFDLDLIFDQVLETALAICRTLANSNHELYLLESHNTMRSASKDTSNNVPLHCDDHHSRLYVRWYEMVQDL